MAILKVITAPDPLLSKHSEPVKNIDSRVSKIVEDMFETMYYENGIGLSAVQVGILERIIVVDVSQKRDNMGNLLETGEQFTMINPEIVVKSDEKNEYEEGCLSFPSESVKIVRPSFIEVQFLNLKGEVQKIKADGLFATCIQHEIDHLNGITISNYLSHLRKELMIKRLLKAKKRFKL